MFPIGIWAILLFWVGFYFVRRGAARRTGREVHCASCDYSLGALLAASNAGELICPECGADCSGPGRVQIGTKQRRRALLAIGIALMLLSATPLLVHMSGIDTMGLKPLWLVQRESQAINAQRAELAQGELIRRITEQRLSDEQTAALVERALAAQTEHDRPIGRWGDVFAALRKTGATTAEQEAQFVDQLLAFALAARPTVAVGDPIPFQITGQWRGPRDIAMPGVPQQGNAAKGLEISVERLRLGSIELEPPERSHRVVNAGSQFRFLSDLQGDLPDTSLPTAPDLPGEHELIVQCSVTWSADQAAAFGAGGPPVFTREISAPVQIVTERPALKTVQADRSDLQLGVDVLVPMASRTGESMVALRSLPEFTWGRLRDYAFEAVLVAGDVEHPLGAYAHSRIDSVGGVWEVPSELLATLTPEQRAGAIIRLIPSEEIARHTVAVTTITAAPVELPVRLPPPREQPAH